MRHRAARHHARLRGLRRLVEKADTRLAFSARAVDGGKGVQPLVNQFTGGEDGGMNLCGNVNFVAQMAQWRYHVIRVPKQIHAVSTQRLLATA